MSYTKQALGSEFFIKSTDILFEQGLSDLDINVQTWENTKCFFYNGDKSVLPFDIFAAAFYLLSRYEEYLPHVKDEFGRFTPSESLAYKHKFLKQPVVDIWAYKFKAALEEQFPDFKFPNKTYSIKPVIDVPTPYRYKLNGIIRTVGGALKDLVKFRFKALYTRFMVLFNFKHDPYDFFKYLINKQKQSKFKFIYFFLLGEYSTYDKAISANNKAFISLIKHIADYSSVGLKISFFAIDDTEVLKKEITKIEDIINKPLKATRQSFSKLNLPESYRRLIELNVHEDYTMGYPSEVGFRAGSCTPFLFYDLDYEVQTPLKICPYHTMDFALLKYKSLLDKKRVLNNMIQEVKQVNGVFVPVFHNYSLSDATRWTGFKELFNIILNSANHEN